MESKSFTNREITKKVDETCSYVNSMYFIAMSLKSKKLNKVLNDFENFKETFPRISEAEWGTYSDMSNLPLLLDQYNYNGWLVEVVVPERDHLKTKNNSQNVVRKKFIYCDHFDEIIPQMLEFSKDVLEEDIIKFNRDKNEN